MILYQHRDIPIILSEKYIEGNKLNSTSFKLPGVVQSIYIRGNSVSNSEKNLDSIYITTEYSMKNISINLLILNELSDNPLDLIFDTNLSKINNLYDQKGRIQEIQLNKSTYKQIEKLEKNIFGLNNIDLEDELSEKNNTKIFQIIHPHINGRGIHYVIPKSFSTKENTHKNFIEILLDFIEVKKEQY